MTEEKLRERVAEMLATDKPFIEKLVEKAIASGCMDIIAADDNYILPKNLLGAIYREMSFQYGPVIKANEKEERKNIQNIYFHL